MALVKSSLLCQAYVFLYISNHAYNINSIIRVFIKCFIIRMDSFIIEFFAFYIVIIICIKGFLSDFQLVVSKKIRKENNIRMRI